MLHDGACPRRRIRAVSFPRGPGLPMAANGCEEEASRATRRHDDATRPTQSVQFSPVKSVSPVSPVQSSPLQPSATRHRNSTQRSPTPPFRASSHLSPVRTYASSTLRLRPVDSSTQPTTPATDDAARASKPAGRPASNNQAPSKQAAATGTDLEATRRRHPPVCSRAVRTSFSISATPTQIYALHARTHMHLAPPPSPHPSAPPPPHAHLQRTYILQPYKPTSTPPNLPNSSQLIPSIPSRLI
jgi:hypothetical protein